MDTSDLKRIYIYKKMPAPEGNPYDAPVNYWFLPAENLSDHSQSNSILHQTRGIRINGAIIHSVLLISNDEEARNTEADAVLVDYRLMSAAIKLKKLLSFAKKPLIYTLNRGIRKIEKIVDEAKMCEQIGVSAILTGNLLSNAILDKIKKALTIPVISKSDSNIETMKSRINAGADIICLMGMEISRILIEDFKILFPRFPVLSYVGNSEELITNSLISGVEAIIYKPWIQINYFK